MYDFLSTILDLLAIVVGVFMVICIIGQLWYYLTEGRRRNSLTRKVSELIHPKSLAPRDRR